MLQQETAGGMHSKNVVEERGDIDMMILEARDEVIPKFVVGILLGRRYSEDGLATLRARDVSSVAGTMGYSSSGIRDFSSVTRTRNRLSVEGTGVSRT